MELILVLTLVVVSFLIAIRASVKKYNQIIPPPKLTDYGVSGYSATKWQIVLSVLGTSLGGAITIGFIGLIYKSGVAFYIAGLSFLIGLVMLYAMIPRIRYESIKNGYTSIEQYISGESNALRFLSSIVNVFAFVGLLASQLISLKILILSRFPQLTEYLFPTIFAVIVIYTALYGLLGVMENDKAQLFAILFWVGAILFVLFSDIDGLKKIGEIDESMLNGLGMGIPFVAVVVIFLPWTALARGDHWQRIVAAETDDIAKSAYGILIIVMFLVYTVFTICGLYLVANYPGIDPNNSPLLILNKIPAWLVTFAVVGIVAALISSADSFLNISSISSMYLVQSIAKTFNPNGSLSKIGNNNDSFSGNIYRLFTVVVGALSYGLVILYDDLGAWVIMATSAVIPMVPAFIGNMLDPAGSKTPSVVSLGFGILCYALALITDIIKPEEAFIVAAVGATIGYLAVKLVFGKLLK